MTEPTGLVGINMESAVNKQGQPFVKVRAEGKGRHGAIHLLGQLSPQECRQHALEYLAAAEAAEQDALVMREITEVLGQGASEEDLKAGSTAAALIQGLRRRRLDGR